MQHRTNVGDIAGLPFLPVSIAVLDDCARSLIRSAESAGLPVTNRVHVSNVLGVTDFDLVIAPAAHNEFDRAWSRALPPPCHPVRMQHCPRWVAHEYPGQRTAARPEL